jgi:thymidylate synthase (FAD)
MQSIDPLFKVKVIAQTPTPQRVIYAAMHQDYSSDFVGEKEEWPGEKACGEIAVKCLLSGNRGHFGSTEHPQIVLACGYFPHSVMQQARTHRVGISFDVQSFRYTGTSIAEATWGSGGYQDNLATIEQLFYLRPVGDYSDRQGKKYSYTEAHRDRDLQYCWDAMWRYASDIQAGFSEEHARGKLPFDYRQHFVMSLNVRSFMHFLDLRSKKDAQLEIQQLCELMWPHFQAWVPEIAAWYESNRLGKARLAP